MKQSLANMRANEAGASGYEKIHGRKLPEEDWRRKMEDGPGESKRPLLRILPNLKLVI
jgi:hypothetical protein